MFGIVHCTLYRKGGPADATSLLKPFDRILQINQTRTTGQSKNWIERFESWN